MLAYPVRVIPVEDNMVVLTFHDVPEAVIVAADEQDAYGRAPAVLETVLGSYLFEGRTLPAPSDVCGAPVVRTQRFASSDLKKLG